MNRIVVVVFAAAFVACSDDPEVLNRDRPSDPPPTTETCGGAHCSGDQVCGNTRDQQNVCTDPVTARCNDGVKNAGETDVDCGFSCRSASPPNLCPAGKSCQNTADCNGTINLVCSSSGVCTVATTPVPGRDFTITVSPTTLNLVQGGTAGTVVVNTSVLSGTGETIALTAASSCSGMTWNFNPASVTTGGSSTLTVNATGTAPAGTCTLTITGTSPSATHVATVNVTVTAPVVQRDFTFTPTPATTVTIAQGGTGTVTFNSTAIGQAENIVLNVASSCSGVAGSVTPGTFLAGTSSTLTVTVQGTAPAGSCTVTVTATSPSATRIVTIPVTVTAPTVARDFSLSLTPASATLGQGASGNISIGSTVLSGTGETVSLTASTSCSGVTWSFNPISFTAGQTSNLNVSVGSTATVGNCTLTVTGTSPSVSRVATVNLTVTTPAGSTCDSTTNCPPGQICGALSQCIIPGASRTTCTQNSDCLSGLCNGSVCAPAPFWISAQPSGITVQFWNPTTLVRQVVSSGTPIMSSPGGNETGAVAPGSSSCTFRTFCTTGFVPCHVGNAGVPTVGWDFCN